ncbi:hypothetical protein GWE18_32900 [Bradyrhizobium sp. CSA112]|nr:hypothetical protein [Bradyrhizobium sp. CSA112]
MPAWISTGTVKVAIADWAVCLRAAHPAYISWGSSWPTSCDWQINNVVRLGQGTRACRVRAVLLQGIAICGRCGRRMRLRYSAPNGDYPVYCCRSDRDQEGSALCQEVRALAVDALVERVVLDALMSIR